MFEPRGWSQEGRVSGPVPLAPTCLEPGEVLAWAGRAPLTGAWLDAIAAVDPESLRGDQRMELVLAWERIRRGSDARFTAALGSIAARPCRPDPGDPSCDGGPGCAHDWSREEAAAALTLGPQHAAHLLTEARELTSRLPGMLAEVAAGEASLLHARKLACHTVELPDAGMVEAVAAAVAGRAGSVTASAFNRMIVAAIDRLRTPEETLAAHAKTSRRRTGITPLPPMEDGMGGAVLIGPAERIAQLFSWARTFTLKNRDPADPRTVGQRRFDALIDAVTGSSDVAFGWPSQAQASPSRVAPHPVSPTNRRRGSAGATPSAPPDVWSGTAERVAKEATTAWSASEGGAPDDPAGAPASTAAGRPRVALKLVMSAETLAGLNEDPAWLEGHGTLPAALARRLAVDPATIQRLLVHPETGALLDLSPEMRSPNAGLTRYVKARDVVCAFPGCGGNADYFDLDHIRDFQDGGLTTRANLHCLCKRHHRAKHAGGWSITRHPDGTETWTSPSGHEYRTEATRYPTCDSEGRSSDPLADSDAPSASPDGDRVTSMNERVTAEVFTHEGAGVDDFDPCAEQPPPTAEEAVTATSEADDCPF